MAGALALLGVERALVVSSHDALDEMSISAPTTVVEVDGADLTDLHRAPGGCRAGPSADPDAGARRLARGERRDDARDLRRRDAGRGATSPCSTRAPRSTPPAAPTTSPPASPPRRPRSTTAPATRTLDALVAHTRASSASRRTQPHERPRADRRRARARTCAAAARRCRCATLEDELAGRGDDRPFSEALTLPGVSVIAEHKRRSPSAGTIREGATVAERRQRLRARRRRRAVDPHRGARTSAARWTTCARRARPRALPILRKDFIVDPYQLYESAAAGADAILLIVAALDADDARRAATREARALDLDVLVEVHDEDELECALELIDADVIGINNRDLTDFSVDIERTFELLADIPAGKTVVSESGFHSRDQLDELERVGVDGVLVGESLMRAPDPEAALRALTGADTDDKRLVRRCDRDGRGLRDQEVSKALPFISRADRRHRRRRRAARRPAAAAAARRRPSSSRRRSRRRLPAPQEGALTPRDDLQARRARRRLHHRRDRRDAARRRSSSRSAGSPPARASSSATAARSSPTPTSCRRATRVTRANSPTIKVVDGEDRRRGSVDRPRAAARRSGGP